MSEIATVENALPEEFELIAQAMMESKGDLAKASRSPTVEYNAMALRAVVKANPAIRNRYHALLAEVLMEKGLHIAERILEMAELKEQAKGSTIIDEISGESIDIPADINAVIAISKEISRLMDEGKSQNMSAKTAILITSKEDAKELLAAFLDS